MPLIESNNFSRMFAPETPSRIERRINDLDAQEDDLPTLPDLPSLSDGDITFPDSPAPRSTKILPARDPSPPPRPASPSVNNTPSDPYTSTPAPSSYLRSHSTIHPSASSVNTTRGPLSQHFPRSGSSRAALDEDELELPSLDDASSIGKVDSLDDDREDMVVLSGSGEDSEGPRRSPLRAAQEEADHTSSSQGSLDAFFKSPALPALSPPPTNPHDYSLPVSEPASERAARLQAASSHVSMRRRQSHKAVSSLSRPADENDDNEQEDASKSLDLPSTFSPLRELTNGSLNQGEVTGFSSPGIGRHASPLPSPHSLLPVHFSPSPSPVPKPPHAHFSLDSPLPATPAHPTPASHRAAHLLATLQSTSKPRLARGTPHRGNESVDGSETSSADLTTFRKANTSLPSAGAETGSTRFNGAKLNAYLHTLNTHLTEENVSLVQTLGGAKDEVARLKRETRVLEERVRDMSVAGGGSESESAVEREYGVDGMEGLVRSHEGIVSLQRQIVEGLGGSPVESEGRREREKRVERAERALEEREEEVRSLRERIVELERAQGEGEEALVAQLQREVFELKDAVGEKEREREEREVEVGRLRVEFEEAGKEGREREDELLLELEARDGELEVAREELGAQEEEFAEKMRGLEEELCRVMEEQEAGLEKAREEMEEGRREDERARKEENAKLVAARSRIAELENEVEQLNAAKDDLTTEQAATSTNDDLVRQLRNDVVRLEDTLKAKDDEIAKLYLSMDEFESRIDALDQEESETKRQFEVQAENVRQMEDALDESARQLLQNEEDLETLRAQLGAEKTVVAGLGAQIAQLSVHKTKAKSPLANEVFSHSRDAVVATLEEELDVARGEIRDLKERLVEVGTTTTVEVQDVQIRTLEGHKLMLEERVESLRKQVDIQLSPQRTPEKSLFFKPIVGLATPKTPGQFMSNLSAWSPGAEGNSTITPLLAQIHELELIVARLQAQLASANIEIDHKLEKLEAAGSGTIALARQLAVAKEKIARLEEELGMLLGEKGSLERVRTRLQTISCPECNVSFDANRIVQLRIDKSAHSVTFAENAASKGPRNTESLRVTLAGVNAKLDELKKENAVLQDAASRSKSLTVEKVALQKDFEQAKMEIASLHGERVDILCDVGGLQVDLDRVRKDCTSLGLDLAAVRRERDERGARRADGAELVKLQEELRTVRKRLAVFEQKVAEHVCPSDANALGEMKARHSQEAKGLLVMIRYLKLRVTREATFRGDMGYQKEYLSTMVKEKQLTIDSTMSTLAKLGLPRPTSPRRSKLSFKGAAVAVIALSRMSILSRQWKEQSASKTKLRTQAYPDVRGRPFAG